VYLATSDSIQGLVAQGRTVSETLEIARDVARKLIEAQKKNNLLKDLPAMDETFGLYKLTPEEIDLVMRG